MTAHRTPPAIAVALVAGVMLIACGGRDEDTAAQTTVGTATPAGFADTLRAARGQTVRWWLYGGDEKVNAYVDEIVAPAARRLGVRLERVPVTDTADAVGRVVAERRAGKASGGSVDLIWINGENFAAGKRAGLWLTRWATRLPNARYLDQTDPAIRTDFQVRVDGQESPWQRAAFVFAYDRDRVRTPPRDLDGLLAYARKHPGRFSYPAPPDFTGSAFVRQAVAAKGEQAAFAYLKELRPFLYRRGATYPKSETELSRLFGDAEVDFAMSYDPAFVNSEVRKGQFPSTARPFRLGDGSLQNTSFVTIPAAAAHPEGAQVIADLLLSPQLQATKADPSSLGNPTVLDLDRLGDRRALFAGTAGSRYVLADPGRSLPELRADRVEALEQRWTRDVLRPSS
ncbi:MAG: ABC transporter substrate-binding protein [Solirubrobacterales bacterium]|nr:ABC transporter substrate-binding protein [Solirubrobacterales bacterium]